MSDEEQWAKERARHPWPPPHLAQQPRSWQAPQLARPVQPWQQPSPSQPPPPGRPEPTFAPPQQFQVVPDSHLTTQRSTRVATRALIWALVAFVISAIPGLGLLTLAPAIPALQIGIAARMQRLGGGGRAVWAIVLAWLALLGSVVWQIVWFVALVGALVEVVD